MVGAPAADKRRLDDRDDLRRPRPARAGTVRLGGGLLEGLIRPEQVRCQDEIDPPGDQVFLGDRDERPTALAEDADLLGHGQS